jgi:cobalt-zinc-cadmium efflux system outer membrane protein
MKSFSRPTFPCALGAILLTAASLRAQTPSPEPTPVQLPALVAEITASNPELKFYEAEIAAAKAGRRSAAVLKDPELSLDLGRKRSVDRLGVFEGEGTAWAVSAGLMQLKAR